MTNRIQDAANQVAASLKAAASEVLGINFEKFDDYFKVHSARVFGEDCIAVVEKVSGQNTTITIDINKLEKEGTDRFFYTQLRDLARLIDPLIPDEEKKIPKDEWPEPKWQPPEEKKE